MINEKLLKHYSMETLQYLQSSQSRETESGQLHYSFYDSENNYIKLSIPDVVSNLLDLSVEYRANGETHIAKIKSYGCSGIFYARTAVFVLQNV